MKKKIFITGISSFIMQKLFSKIGLSEYEVIGLTRNPALIQLDGVEIIEGDICDIDSFSPHIQGCHMIIHAAAVTHSYKEIEYYKVNLDATKKLVDMANSCQVKRFVFISSNAAGTTSGAYGLTKILAEEYIQKNFDGWTILRPSEIYGLNSTEGIEKLINDVIDKPIVLCPLGVPSKFFPIHVDDAVQMMYDNIFDNEHINKLFVIHGMQGFSFLEVIKLTASISHKKIRIIFIRKEIMFMIKKIAEIVPFYVGLIPDQIDRLYSRKYNENSVLNLIKLETYIEKLVETKKRLATKA